MSEERHEILATHLKSMERVNVYPRNAIVDGILADPQRHIDALCAAGLLRIYDDDTGIYYTVVPPQPPQEEQDPKDAEIERLKKANAAWQKLAAEGVLRLRTGMSYAEAQTAYKEALELDRP